MTSQIYEALWRRAKIYLKEAERLLEEGVYDLSLVMSEQAIQLAVKAEIYKYLGEVPKGHNLRRLIAYLASLSKSEELRRFVLENRETLILLEDAYLEGRYGPPYFTKEEAMRGVEVARRLLETLRQIHG